MRLRVIAGAIAVSLAGIGAMLIVMTILTARSADPALWPPAAAEPSVEIHVVSHGYHSALSSNAPPSPTSRSATVMPR